MKVFILWTGYEDIEGVYSTRELAQAALDKHFAERTYIFKSRENYSIVETTLDNPDAD